MPKDASLANLYIDLGYIIHGTFVHEFLFEKFPPSKDAVILEPGCGSAKFSLSYAMKGCIVNAFDYDDEVVEYANRLKKALTSLAPWVFWGGVDPSISQGSIFEMRYPDNSFDLVFNEGVPQHWPDEYHRQRSIDEMVRVSRDTVIIIGNNGHNPDEQETDRTFDFGYAGMPPTRKCFTREELKERMERSGLVDVQIEFLGAPRGMQVYASADAVLLAGYGRKA